MCFTQLTHCPWSITIMLDVFNSTYTLSNNYVIGVFHSTHTFSIQHNNSARCKLNQPHFKKGQLLPNRVLICNHILSQPVESECSVHSVTNRPVAMYWVFFRLRFSSSTQAPFFVPFDFTTHPLLEIGLRRKYFRKNVVIFHSGLRNLV